jgi:hypothetical protein
MARDFEDIHDISDLSDTELRGLVREHLEAHNGLDIDDFTVRVENGTVVLEGRVGTEGERLIADHIVSDTLGITDYRNDVFVDPMRRATNPEAVDETLTEADRTEGLLLGDKPVQMSDEAEEVDENLDVDLEGTTDVRKAIEQGAPWIPPESPTQEGLGEEDAGENH